MSGSVREPVQIGFIGCGGNARGHMRRLRDVAGAEVVAVCDVVPELAQRAADETGAVAYTDHRALLDHRGLRCVYISIPVHAHGAPELDTLDRGLPFLVEKPVAIEMAQAREIEQRVAETGVLTAVGYQLRYGGTVDLAWRILAGKRIGLALGRYWCNTGAGDPDTWLRRMASSGGQLVEQATHTIDILRCLVGEIEEVYCAATNQVLREIDCPDFNAVSLKFSSGAVGSLTTSWAFAQGWGHTNVVDLLYEDAMLTWTLGKLTVHQAGMTEEQSPAGPGIDEVFIQAVRSGDASAIRSPYADAVRSLSVSLAMNRSAAEGRPVRVADMG